jgi:hypothetical protein
VRRMFSRMVLWTVVLFLLLVGGCMTRPLKGGRAVTSPRPGGVVEQMIVQGENPAQVTKQDQETVKVRSYTVPAGSRMEEARVQVSEGGQAVTNVQALVVAAPMPVQEREETRAKTELGASQKDTTREVGAKLASLKGVIWVGVGLFLFGLATLFYPPLRLLIASITTSVAIVLGGVALMVLPSLIVGNELLILSGVGAIVGGWFLAHRHGQLRGLVENGKSADEAAGSESA